MKRPSGAASIWWSKGKRPKLKKAMGQLVCDTWSKGSAQGKGVANAGAGNLRMSRGYNVNTKRLQKSNEYISST